jgi:hypothetical protein
MSVPALIVKTLLSAALISIASEVGKRSTLLGALLISLPLSSVLALSYLWLETRDSARVSAMASGILWAILPSLAFFILLPILLRAGVHFAWAMLGSCLAMAGFYAFYVRLAGNAS